MTRAPLVIALALALAVGNFAVAPHPAAAATPTGAITWTVDHKKKTITVYVKLQIYSGCSGNPVGSSEDAARSCRGVTSQVTQFIADKIKTRMEKVWNKGYSYRCYRLIVIVDIKVATDGDHLDGDRLGVRIDPSPVNVRSWVDVGRTNDTSKWQSNDPADAVVPENGDTPTTWTEGAQSAAWIETYAHELGHILGLHDGYHDEKDPTTGKSKSVPNTGAPLDLMSTGQSAISQETINRLVERNRDHLVDKDGHAVNLEDLVCEPQFLVVLKADQVEYNSSNLMSSMVDPPCSRQAFTASTDQRLSIDSSEQVEVRLVETPEQPLGYVLVPAFDVLTLQNGMSGGGRSAAAVGLFDLPIKVVVRRQRSQPATGELPPVFDFPDTTCVGGDGGSQQPADCGVRTYPSWLAMSQIGNDELWPVGSSLPAILKDIGYSSTRLDRLYKNCSGPTPWPGAFTDGAAATITRGKLPPLATLVQVSNDWRQDGKPGRIDIDGDAALNKVDPGNLTKDSFFWTLTLCPLNADGMPPPDCP